MLRGGGLLKVNSRPSTCVSGSGAAVRLVVVLLPVNTGRGAAEWLVVALI